MRSVALALSVALLLPLPSAAAAADGPRHAVELIAASDGVRVQLHRYAADGGPSRWTLLLLPDVGTTRRVYDFAGIGLAPWLALHGVEVYVLEWRGAGGSEVPLGGYALEDLLDGDAEAALARAAAGAERVFVGGLGLGGTLALELAARHPDQVAGFVGLQAAALLEVPNDPVARAVAAIPPAPWLDLGAAAREPLIGPRTAFELLLANDGSIAPGERDRFAKYLLAPVPRRLAVQVAAAMGAGELQVGGRAVRAAAALWKGPSLLVFAPRDNWIHPEFSTPLRGWLAGPVRVKVLDPLEGAQRDYGHLGMVLGVGAARDVFEPVRRFLAEGAP